MSFTRKSIADHLDSYDDEIAQLQESKRETLADYREQLAEKGFGKAAIKAEVEALKVAMRRRRAIVKKGAEEIENADALADEIFVEISGPAPRATHVANSVPDHDPETGEITEQPETANQSATSEGESDAIAKSADDRNVSENNLINGAGQAGQEAGRQPPVETCNDEAPTESAADTISAPNFTGPQLSAVPGGEPSKPSSDDGGAKTDGGDAAIPVRSDDQSAYRSTQSEQAANPIPDDDVPAFLKKDRYVLRPHCLNPSLCAGSGAKHCHACTKAMAETEVAA